MPESQADRTSHKERVAMRELVRSSGIIGHDQPTNEELDKWLTDHGYLAYKGYVPPEDRVQRLAHRLGRKGAGYAF